MVKVSETIICQRFVQNAWKKDLCSNCFKSKEDHVTLPEKKIAYRWTSHVNKFPQHGILKDRQKNGLVPKARTVSFHTTEIEVIGFGGEEVSSDDEYFPSFGGEDHKVVAEADNEEEDKEFRKLTRSNTDFNSVPSNLKSDKPVVNGVEARNNYTNLKLGKPLTGADGRRQTLQVVVEPFGNALPVNGSQADEQPNKIRAQAECNNEEKTEETTDSVNGVNSDANNNNSNNNNCSEDESDKPSSDGGATAHSDNCDNKETSMTDTLINKVNTLQCCDKKCSDEPQNCVSISSVAGVTETVNEANVYVKANSKKRVQLEEEDEPTKYSTVSNVLVNPTCKTEEAKAATKSEIAENMKNAKSILEPLFRLGAKREEHDKSPKFSIYQFSERKSSSSSSSSTLEKEKNPVCSINKDCNPIHLPLVASKGVDIDLDDKPESREMVGEPDGKADSDDSYDAVLPAEDTAVLESAHANPQRSFLHGFTKEKPKPASKPLNLAPLAEGTPKKVVCHKDSNESVSSVPSTPKMANSASVCHGTGSTKRQAPKPPSPKMAGSRCSTVSLPVMVQSVQCGRTTTTGSEYGVETKRCESPLVNGTRDAISFLGENGPPGAKRKLNLECASSNNQSKRNSVSLCVSMVPNGGTDGDMKFVALNGYHEKDPEDGDRVSMASIDRSGNARSPVKCSRSLSCDSIISPNALSSVLPLSEKSRKYASATIKVKSTFKKLLRFTSKDDDKADNENAVPVAPRRRIEIIHPLDLNKNSIEILRSQPVNDVSDRLEESKKRIENIENTPPASNLPEINYANCPAGRPNKPPPPPRNQSLDQKLVSEISRPVRPPPPKSAHLKTQTSPKCTAATNSSCNVYENLGESPQSIAPAKPQRASSMRDRARPTITIKTSEENLTSLGSESEAIPECDRIRLLHERQSSDTSDKPHTTCNTYCGSETESDICYQSVSSNGTANSGSELSDVVLQDCEMRKSKSVVHSSLEDNYGAVVVANHEALTSLLDQVNQTSLIPNSLKGLQAAVHTRFSHFSVIESSRIVVGDWHFYNAKWAGQNFVLSLSSKHLGPMKSLPTWITLYPIVKFTDVVPSRYIKDECIAGKMDAYVTVWNEERIESVSSFCRRGENTITFSENGLLLTQLLDALKYLQACGNEDISLEEILICKRESDAESKLLLLPVSNVDYMPCVERTDNKDRISLCECASTVLGMLLPKLQITDTVKKILSGEKAASLSQAKAVAEYWLWGPYNVTLTSDRQTSLQRWLDLERATYLYKMICRKPNELSLNERCHMMFLVRTNAKSLTEASYLLEKPTAM